MSEADASTKSMRSCINSEQAVTSWAELAGRLMQGLLEEATFYDKQWSATWEGQERPKESEAS